MLGYATCARPLVTASAVIFDYGSKHNNRELPVAQALCSSPTVPHTLIPPSVIDLFIQPAPERPGNPRRVYDVQFSCIKDCSLTASIDTGAFFKNGEAS